MSRSGLSAALLVASQLLALPNQTDASDRLFSGQATAVRASVLGVTTAIADTGPQPTDGDALEASTLEASVPDLLSGEGYHATTIGHLDESNSEASMANLNLTVGGNRIAASFLMARVRAVYAPDGASVTPTSEVAGLVINGLAIAVTGQPNQTIALLNGRVIINEQTSSTVNALRVVIDGLADVVVASAQARIGGV